MTNLIYFIIIPNLVCWVGILIAAALGYMVSPGSSLIIDHVFVGLMSAIFAIFGLIVMMFYFIATGAVIKDAVRTHGLDPKFYGRTVAFKKKVFPATSLSLILVMTSAIIGAGVDVGRIPAYIHGVLALLAIVAYIIAIYQTRKNAIENSAILDSVHEQLADLADKERL